MDAEHIRDLFAAFGPVDVRRMFGGEGLYRDGVMFALVADGALYLKADERSVAAFERERCQPFTHETRGGRRAVMSYWRLPERLYDDPDELATWARQALLAAQAASTAKKQSGKRRRSTGGK